MLSRPIEAAVFIGGMEGIFQEHEIFRALHGSAATALAVGAPGGAARQLAQELSPGERLENELDGIDFCRLIHERLGIAPDKPRHLQGVQDERSEEPGEEKGWGRK